MNSIIQTQISYASRHREETLQDLMDLVQKFHPSPLLQNITAIFIKPQIG